MLIIITGAVTGIVAVGAYLRWAVRPVIVAYHVGRDVERLIASPARLTSVFKLAYGIGRRDRAR